MAEWTRATPWRQGHLLTQEAAQSLGLCHQYGPADTWVVVASHDCDLAQLPASELMVEVVVGRQVARPDGNYTHAKTARTLHISFEGATPLLVEFVITAKCSIPKEGLAAFQPNASLRLSPQSLATFQRWLAARYQRAAFPDVFEGRLKQYELDKKISKALKPHGELITAVLFDVDEGREVMRQGPDDLYTLDITLLHAVEPDFDKAEAAAQQVAAEIQDAFDAKLKRPNKDQWQEIELRNCDAISEHAITYYQFSVMKRYRLDHLSLGADPQQSVMAE